MRPEAGGARLQLHHRERSEQEEGRPIAETETHHVSCAALAAGCAAPAQTALLDYLHAHIALQDELDHHGTAGWVHRSVYELVAAHGRWYTPTTLPAGIRPLPERQCFANAAATEQHHPHLA